MSCDIYHWLLRNSNLLSGNLCGVCGYTSAGSQLSESTIGMVAMQGGKVIAQCSRYGVQPTAVAVLSTSLSSDAGAVVCVPVDML